MTEVLDLPNSILVITGVVDNMERRDDNVFEVETVIPHELFKPDPDHHGYDIAMLVVRF